MSDCREGREGRKKRGVAGSCSGLSHPSSFFLSPGIWCILHSGLQQITFKARAKNGEGRKTAHGHPAGDTLGHNGDFIMLKVLPPPPSLPSLMRRLISRCLLHILLFAGFFLFFLAGFCFMSVSSHPFSPHISRVLSAYLCCGSFYFFPPLSSSSSNTTSFTRTMKSLNTL